MRQTRPPDSLIPDYIKFYSVYQYDRIKFRKLLKAAKISNPPKNIEDLKRLQKEILKQCYVRDERGELVSLSDEPHIFRYAVLYRLYNEIYKCLQVNNNKTKEYKGLRIFKDKYTKKQYRYKGKTYQGQKFTMYGAEIIGSENWSLKDRVHYHIELLRFLRKRNMLCLK